MESAIRAFRGEPSQAVGSPIFLKIQCIGDTKKHGFQNLHVNQMLYSATKEHVTTDIIIISKKNCHYTQQAHFFTIFIQ